MPQLIKNTRTYFYYIGITITNYTLSANKHEHNRHVPLEVGWFIRMDSGHSSSSNMYSVPSLFTCLCVRRSGRLVGGHIHINITEIKSD